MAGAAEGISGRVAFAACWARMPIKAFAKIATPRNKAFGDEFHAFFGHGFFEVMYLHNAKVIGLDGDLQGSGSRTHGFVGR
ncbi:hypothetical protein [Methylobacter tundripaludum]|uniref:hypothetical protein n=1 Tax=Methylobacter tundripaludum TaxID=173365 RepID=UPI0001E51A1B|nr:hypothetical protein [Methylobacter tundripaludum]